MKLSGKQKKALEKITGKPWDTWPSEAVEAYFAFTDRGMRTDLFQRAWRLQMPDNEFTEVEKALWDLMQSHIFHPVSVEGWKQDFKKGLLFLSDFKEEDSPEAYLQHVCEVYASVMGTIPSCYLRHSRMPPMN